MRWEGGGWIGEQDETRQDRREKEESWAKRKDERKLPQTVSAASSSRGTEEAKWLSMARI